MVGRGADAVAEQVRGHLLAGLAASAVDDGREPFAVLQVRQQHARLAGLAGHVQHLQEQVGAVETGARHHRFAQLQRGDDVAGDARRGRGGQGQRRRGAEPLAHIRQPQIVGPEVVSPLRQAVRLVDREAVDVGLSDRVQEAAAGEALGGDVDQARAAGGDAGEGNAHLLTGHDRGDHLDVLVPAGAKRGRLVLHQRDQRRDDQRDAFAEQRRQLVAERLARPGGHDREHVAARQGALDRLALPRTEALEAEQPLQLGREIGGGGARDHGRQCRTDHGHAGRCDSTATRS